MQSNVLCKLLPTPFAIKDEREALLFFYFFYDVMGFFHSLIDARKMLGWLIQEIFTFSTLHINTGGFHRTHRRQKYGGSFPNSLWPISYFGSIWELYVLDLKTNIFCRKKIQLHFPMNKGLTVPK